MDEFTASSGNGPQTRQKPKTEARRLVFAFEGELDQQWEVVGAEFG